MSWRYLQDIWGQAKSGRAESEQTMSGQVQTGQVGTGHVRTGPLKTCRPKSICTAAHLFLTLSVEGVFGES